MSFVRHYLVALQFFTRIPVMGRLGQWVGYSPQMLRASAGHFPGVGLVVGGVAALVYAGLALQLPHAALAPLLAAVLSTAATAWLTGAFHEDGLADVADGLGGSAERARALEIMKDSRIGAFGALALMLALLAKTALLALLGSTGWQLACVAMVLGHVTSRAWPLLVIRLLPYVGDAALSKSKPIADQISNASLVTAALWLALTWTLAIASGSLGAVALAAGLGAAGVGFIAVLRLFRRRLQGFTGDCLGATQQVCEVAFYLGLALGA